MKAVDLYTIKTEPSEDRKSGYNQNNPMRRLILSP